MGQARRSATLRSCLRGFRFKQIAGAKLGCGKPGFSFAGGCEVAFQGLENGGERRVALQ